MQSDPNEHGTPPASAASVAALPRVIVGPAEVEAGAECAVCKDAFAAGDEATRLPCKHLYHGDCISPWLESHSTCPVCRHQMPTEADG